MVPFPLQSIPWEKLTERDRSFFNGERYQPLPLDCAAQVRLLVSEDAERLTEWFLSTIPYGWPEGGGHRFPEEAMLFTYQLLNDETGRAKARRWLFERGLPFQREIFLLYGRHRVVQTTWKVLVRYWDAFAWSVGYSMLAFDHTLRWAGCFHHEHVIVFGSKPGFAPTRRRDGAYRSERNA